MSPGVGRVVLGLSAMGFPLTQLAIRRFGRRGALLAEVVCAGLLVRDAAMLANGVPGRLRRGPAILLWLETGAAAGAALTGLRPLFDAEARAHAARSRADRFETMRRATVRLLFGLHTARFRIYLQPDRGLRQEG